MSHKLSTRVILGVLLGYTMSSNCFKSEALTYTQVKNHEPRESPENCISLVRAGVGETRYRVTVGTGTH